MAIVFGASSASALIVNANPAWNGWVRAEMPTEVAVRFVSDRGGRLTLTLSDRSISYTHKATLEPNVEFVWRVPLSPPSGEPLQLEAQLDEDPGIEQEIALRRHFAPSPLVAVLADQPSMLQDIRAETIHLAVDSLPFHDSSYAAMDLVLIHRDSLKVMARQQLIALRQHAARCGRIVIVDFDRAAMTPFADVVGCGGRFLVAAEKGAELDTLVTSLLEAPVPQLPAAGSMRALLDDNGIAQQIRPLFVFFTIYLCVLLLVVRSDRAPVYFIGASVAATVIGLVAWTKTSERIDRVAWTEMENRATVARSTSILRVLGGGGGRVTMEIPAEVGPLRALQPMNLLVASNDNGRGAANVSFNTRLFSQHEFIASGVTKLSAPLTVDHSGDVPRIVNTGTDKSPPALLAWNDGRYSVPPLAPNEDWRPPSVPEPWGSNRAEQLFRQRAMRKTTALLFEYPPGNQLTAEAAHGYLMVWP